MIITKLFSKMTLTINKIMLIYYNSREIINKIVIYQLIYKLINIIILIKFKINNIKVIIKRKKIN